MTDAAGMAYCGGGVAIGLKAIGNLFRWSKHVRKVRAEYSPIDMVDARPSTERAVLDHLAAHGVQFIPGRTARSAI